MASPKVFLCYPRASDADGKISRIREIVEQEIRLLTGDLEFKIFQDVATGLGQNWVRVLHDELGQADYLLAVVQPALFTSQSCRQELEAFVLREEELGRDDLILPLYYIECDDFRTSARDPLRRVLASRQYEDLRHVRHAPPDRIAEAAISVARRIVEAFRRSPRPTTPPALSLEGTWQRDGTRASGKPSSVVNARTAAASKELRVLLLAANPDGPDRIAVEREHNLIRDELRASPATAQRVRIEGETSAEATEFLEAFSALNPQILHFSGHGNENGEPALLAADRDGPEATSADLLEETLRRAPALRCVVLNTCYSTRIAKSLIRRLPIVVTGMSHRIEDERARQFTQRLYRGIAHGRDLQSAFDMARSALKVAGESGDLPLLRAHFDVDPDRIVLLPRVTPEHEEPDMRPGRGVRARDDSEGHEVPSELQKALVRMLLSMFSSGEFRRFLRYSSDTASVLLEIPHENSPPIEVFGKAVESLAERGLLFDEDFFERIIKERPRRETEIRQMQARIRSER